MFETTMEKDAATFPVYTMGENANFKLAKLTYTRKFGEEYEVTTDEEGRIFMTGGTAPNDRGEVESVHILSFDTPEEKQAYHWAVKFNKLSKKKQLMVISIYGNRAKEGLVDEPNKLYSLSAAYYRDELGFNETCVRCGGSGQYSWNPQDGHTCFKCKGRGITLVMPKISEIRKVNVFDKKDK